MSPCLALFLIITLSHFCFAAEGRIPISEKYTIGASGSYIVTNDFSATTGSAIAINADNVTVDLDGHTVTGGSGGDAIENQNNHSNISIKNGRIVAVTGRYHIFFQMTLAASSGKFEVQDLVMSEPGDGVYIQCGILGGTSFARAVVRRNTVVDAGDYAIGLYTADNSRVEDNDVRDSTLSGIYLWYTTNSVVVGNNVASGLSAGILLDSSTNILIVDNTITRNTGSGIDLTNSSANTIERNNVSYNSYGIYSGNGTDNVINNNNLSHNTNDGIYLRDSSYNSLKNNTTNANLGNGIFANTVLGTGSDYNSINNNVASKNGDTTAECGILFDANSQNNIYANNHTQDNGTTCTTCGICGASGNVNGGGNVNVN